MSQKNQTPSYSCCCLDKQKEGNRDSGTEDEKKGEKMVYKQKGKLNGRLCRATRRCTDRSSTLQGSGEPQAVQGARAASEVSGEPACTKLMGNRSVWLLPSPEQGGWRGSRSTGLEAARSKPHLPHDNGDDRGNKETESHVQSDN